MFLLPDEKIIQKVNPHWLFLAIPLIEILFFFFLYIFIACPYLGIVIHDLQGFCYFVSLFLLFFLGAVLCLDWKFNRLYLTNQRLIKERGIIGKRFMSIQLTKIQNVSCAFGIFGWFFGYGDLTIESAGTEGKMTFEGMPWPAKIKAAIEKEMQNQNK
jgi:uncharacterized membrane protein YdbT with pleckstrin-like domain